MNSKNIFYFYFLTGLISLYLGLLFAILGAFQYINPIFLKDILPFNTLRPLHVTLVLSCIILLSVGGIYYYVKEDFETQKNFNLLAKINWFVWVLTGIIIILCYFFGKFEGKEYLEFPSYLFFPIIFGWLIFGFNIIINVKKSVKKIPVYLWMWITGICFMIYHFTEAHFWTLPFFREHFLRDIMIQWKAGGSYVGSWNMLVYGTSIYIMYKISGDENLSFSKKSFFFYFLGLTNLMFGWAHHIYIIPTQSWIRYLSYLTSMTEWIVLIDIIWSWSKNLNSNIKEKYKFSYLILLSTDVWIILNLFFVLLISIPSINYYTHGTHFTVAHSMGTTIGINTTILLAALYFIVDKEQQNLKLKHFKLFLYLFNIILFIFWILLMILGYKRAVWLHSNSNIVFATLQDSLKNYYIMFCVSGILVTFLFLLLTFPVFKHFIKIVLENKFNQKQL